ncbi:CPBP family intramembrane glutamic endopeptidase [Roseivirga sp.]|uniref:CPBP family intramembrane glutamic endopeptidase n=1 Tax=Roseivirga sp. TaxID=1964215 RepID=UPI002B277374|nr:CPBP family intramembrane glutamic endopeptidase [Roseivirga sp.]
MARIDNGINISLRGERVDVIKELEDGEITTVTTYNENPRKTFWVVFGLLFAGFFVGQFAATIAILIFVVANGGGMEVLADPVAMFELIGQSQLLISQSLYTVVFTFLVPWFYMKNLARKPMNVVFGESKTESFPLALAVFVTIAFVFVNGFIIEWNENIQLPEFMAGFERLARQMEDSMKETTEMFTTFDSFGTFLLAFVVVAILPGIGEELLFRGLLQNSLHRWSKNAHIAIWVSAFIFSAIHMQFYGLSPRMVLGALFGYLYVWSGNLWYPIIAHITNNGFALIVAYMYQAEVTEINPDEPDTVPGYAGIVALIVVSFLLFVFRNHYLKPKLIR